MTGFVCTRARAAARVAAIACFLVAAAPVIAGAQTELVLHGKRAALHGDWQLIDDASAAGGTRLWNPDRSRPKLTTPLASPADYFELTFFAESGRGYRLWLRGRAERNAWTNDSLYVQFSRSVDHTGAPAYRIGSTRAAMVSVEEGTGKGLDGWGWEDNGWDSLGPLVYFAASGEQTVRVQRREDGVSVDQIVLSSQTYVSAPPGARKNCSTILPENTGAPAAGPITEIAFTAANPSALAGAWTVIDDPSAAGGKAVATVDTGGAKITSASAAPGSYAEYTFTADAGRAYRLWVRGRAEGNYWGNDSVFVQFSGTIDATGTPTARIGSTGAFVVNLEDASGAGLAGWGWQDNGWGAGVLGPLVTFTESGPQTIRLQTREDGYRIDQIVLSAERYLTVAPGALKNDSTILEPSEGDAAAQIETAQSEPVSEPVSEPEPAPLPPPPGSPVRLRVLDWNLHHGVGTDGRYDLERIADWIARMTPDIVILNEVERFTGWGYEDQPERYRAMLEVRTGRPWYLHFVTRYGSSTGAGQGNLILSTIPFDATGSLTVGYQRVALQGTITVNGRMVNLFAAHLTAYDITTATQEARTLTHWASGFAENRLIAGDMNSWPDQGPTAELNTTYNDAWTAALAQGTAAAPADITPYGATKKGRIDYVFVSKGASYVAVIDATVVDTRDAAGHMPSDHRPLLVTVEVR